MPTWTRTRSSWWLHRVYRRRFPRRRPRVFTGPAPEAVDPFAEPFEEEELVLDSFATLASIFGTRTPRVENSREPSISRLVQNALDAFAQGKRAKRKMRRR